MSKGWICPKCDIGVSPHCDACPKCEREKLVADLPPLPFKNESGESGNILDLIGKPYIAPPDFDNRHFEVYCDSQITDWVYIVTKPITIK